jgi:hypothetical protein
MTSIGRAERARVSKSWLDREHTVAKPGFSRWLVPPAALCVHLCITGTWLDRAGPRKAMFTAALCFGGASSFRRWASICTNFGLSISATA